MRCGRIAAPLVFADTEVALNMKILASFVAVLTLAAGEGAAAQRLARGPASPRAFADALLRATRAKDALARELLIHPAVLACSIGEKRIYLDRVFRLERQDAGSNTGPYDVIVTGVGPNPSMFGMPDSLFAYPVPPTTQVEIEFLDKDGTTSGVNVLFVAATPSGWFEVLPCPNAAGVTWLREQERVEQRSRAHGDSLARAMDPSLRATLVSLIRQNRRLDAANQYRNASGQDLGTAMLVVEALARP